MPTPPRPAAAAISAVTIVPASAAICPAVILSLLRSRHEPRASPRDHSRYHAFPESDGSRGSPKDTKLVDFVFERTTRESVGHRRTRHRHVRDREAHTLGRLYDVKNARSPCPTGGEALKQR